MPYVLHISIPKDARAKSPRDDGQDAEVDTQEPNEIPLRTLRGRGGNGSSTATTSTQSLGSLQSSHRSAPLSHVGSGSDLPPKESPVTVRAAQKPSFNFKKSTNTEQNVKKPERKKKAETRIHRIRTSLESKGLKVQKIRAAGSYLLIFRCADSDLTDLLDYLKVLGVGTEYGFINVMYVAASVPPVEPLSRKKVGGTDVQARLPVEVIYNQIAGGAQINFDFIMYLAMAASIAATGLAVDSPVVVVASMLVSPLMGPILAFVFATLLRDWPLGKEGLIAELVGIFVCLVIGFAFGLCFSPFSVDFDWPANEMFSRGTAPGLLIGTLIALPSGVGVALAVTSTNINTLVGVAISASLLPPIVNSGLNLAFAVIGPYVNPGVKSNAYYTVAAYSFLLFAVNVICIYVAALLMLKIKDVVPMMGQSVHWEDLPDYYTRQRLKTRANHPVGMNAPDFASASPTVLGDASLWRWLRLRNVPDSYPTNNPGSDMPTV